MLVRHLSSSDMLNSPLHCLGLAVASEMVGSTAFIAGSRPRTSSEASPETAAEASTTRGTASSTTHSGVGAVAGQVAGKTAGVAASAGAGSAQAESRAVSLDVSESLAVVALLRCPSVSPRFLPAHCEPNMEVWRGLSRTLGGAGMRASVGLVAGLLACSGSACVQWSGRGNADSCSRASPTTSTPRHSGRCCRT
jgi:hypothetical protein